MIRTVYIQYVYTSWIRTAFQKNLSKIKNTFSVVCFAKNDSTKESPDGLYLNH